jgi:ribosome-associated protein
MTKTKKRQEAGTLEEMRCAVDAIEAKKGENIRVLDVRGKSSITDYLILATATSDPHVRALKTSLDDAMKSAKVRLIGEDRAIASGWLVVDAFDFMVHLQTAEMRDFYRLDQLWKDAPEITLSPTS